MSDATTAASRVPAFRGSGAPAGPPPAGIDPRWLAVFDDRYGSGSSARLAALLAKPCLSFAEIGARFGVTRERVRQWHLLLLPDGPRGHARQQLCRVYHQKQRLLSDSLFSSFFHHARTELARGRVHLIRSSDGFRRRLVHIDRRPVALIEARAAAAGTPSFVLGRSRERADFLYYRLGADAFLFLPAREAPARVVVAADFAGSALREYRNTFAAIGPGDDAGGSTGASASTLVSEVNL